MGLAGGIPAHLPDLGLGVYAPGSGGPGLRQLVAACGLNLSSNLCGHGDDVQYIGGHD